MGASPSKRAYSAPYMSTPSLGRKVISGGASFQFGNVLVKNVLSDNGF